MSDAIEIERLRKEYSGLVALDALTLRVPRGSCFGLIGRNGAGKSTTLNLLLGLLRPTSGCAKIEGHDAHRNGERARRGLAFVGEEAPLYPWLTGHETARYWRHLSGTWNEPAFRRCAGEFGLPLDRRVAGFSKGMRTQLSIALAVGKDARVYMLDEPTAGLDPVVRRQVLRILDAEVRENGRTVLVSSHVLSELEQVCTHVAVLDRGQLKASSDIQALRSQWRRYDFIARDDVFEHLLRSLTPLHHENRGDARTIVLRDGHEATLAHLRIASVGDLRVREMDLEEIFFSILGHAATHETRREGSEVA